MWLSLVVAVTMTSLVVAQDPGDPNSQSLTPSPDRYVIDVAELVRTSTVRTLSEVLIGRVPGLLVVPGPGLAGTGSRIRFAGIRSFVGDQPPLILLDGIRIDTRESDSQLLGGTSGPSRLDDVSIEDVQSIEVLSGVAGTAVYGPGAGAGVILIHTKQGRTGPIRVEGFAQGAVRSVPARWPANYGGVDADNPLPDYQDGGCHLIAQAAGACVQDYVRQFNPLAERNPFGSAARRQVGLVATGGPAWGSFRVSGSLDGDPAAYALPAISWDNDAHHWSLRASAALRPMRSLNVAASIEQLSSNLHLPMHQPVRAALTGTSDSTSFTWDPLFSIDPGTQDLDRTFFHLDAGWSARRWLRVEGRLGVDDADQHERQLVPGNSRTIGRRRARHETAGLSASASYRASPRTRLTTTVGLEHLVNRSRANGQLVVPDDTVCGATAIFCSVWRGERKENSFALYALQRIEVGERLVVTGSLRHDNVEEYPSSTHPGLALDWVARRLRGGFFGGLVLRAAYGTARHALPAPAMIGGFADTLKPERTRAFELGASASGLDGRWRAQASIADLRSTVLDYINSSSPGVPGVRGYLSGAVVGNRSITASVTGILIDRAEFGWDVQLGVWGNRNRVIRTPSFVPTFYGDPTRPTGQREVVGYPANGYWTRPLSFADANGDGIISIGEVWAPLVDFAWLGTPHPTQGAVLTSTWRFAQRWRLSATLDYRAGHTLYNQIASRRCALLRCQELHDSRTSLADQATAIASAWLPPWPAPGYFEDADYLKLREVALAFDVPAHVASAFGAREATIVLGGRDLGTWTNYSGADPEAGSYGSFAGGTPMVVGDPGTVPVPRTWMLRVRVSY